MRLKARDVNANVTRGVIALHETHATIGPSAIQIQVSRGLSSNVIFA